MVINIKNKYHVGKCMTKCSVLQGLVHNYQDLIAMSTETMAT